MAEPPILGGTIRRGAPSPSIDPSKPISGKVTESNIERAREEAFGGGGSSGSSSSTRRSRRRRAAARRKAEADRIAAENKRIAEEKAAKKAQELLEKARAEAEKKQQIQRKQLQRQQEQQFFIEQQRRGLNQLTGTRPIDIDIPSNLLASRRPSPSGTISLVPEDEEVFITQEGLREKQRRQQSAIDLLASFNPLSATVRAAEVSGQDSVILIDSPEKGVPLYPGELQSTRVAGLLAAGAGGVVQKPFSAARAVDIARAEELAAKKTVFIGTTKKEAGETVLDIIGGRRTPSAEQTFSGQIRGVELGKGKTGLRFAGEGELKSTTKIESFLKTIQSKGKPVASVTDDVIKVFGKGEIGRTTLIGDDLLQLPTTVKTVLGDVTTVKQPGRLKITGKPGRLKIKGRLGPKQTERTGFTGLSLTEDGTTIVGSGRVSGVKFYDTGRITGKAKQTQFGIIKDITPVLDDAGSAGKVIRGSGKKSSPEFFQALYQDDVGIGIQSLSQSAARKLSPPISKVPPTYPAPVVSLVEPFKETKTTTEVINPRVAEPDLLPSLGESDIGLTNEIDIQGNKTKTRVKQLGKTKTRVKQLGKTKPRKREETDSLPRLDEKQDPAKRQKQRQGTRQIQKQRSENIIQHFAVGLGGFGFGLGFPPLRVGLDLPKRRTSKKLKPSKGRRRGTRGFAPQVTGFEAALGLGARKIREGTFTGFEVTRGVAPKKKTKKGKKKKQPKKKPRWTLI